MNSDKDLSGEVPAKPEANEPWLATMEHEIEELAIQPAEHLLKRVIIRDLPYIAMLSMALLGIGIVTYSGEPVLYYWELLTPLYCGVCVYAGWEHAPTQPERTKLIWTQILHWAAFLVAMWLIHHPVIRDVVNNNATGLNLMTLLALATFVAGVHAEAWRICVVGLILAVSVPAMAWIQQSALFAVIVVLGLLVLAASIWLELHKEKKKASDNA